MMNFDEDPGRIMLDGAVIRYTSASHGCWSIGVHDLRIIGEATNQDGPFADDYFICFAFGPDAWHEASFYAADRDRFLAALSAKLGTTLQLELCSSTDFASRILWPTELAGEPMFKFEPEPARILLGRLMGSTPTRQTFSRQALAALRA